MTDREHDGVAGEESYTRTEGADFDPGRLPRALRADQRLFLRGPSSLSPSELLALIIGDGSRRQTPFALAERILRRHGLAGLKQLPVESWRRGHGLGRATAARLSAVFEIGRRAYRGEGEEAPRITGPGEAYRQVKQIGRAKKEQLVGLYLDAQNGLLRRETISIGSLNTTRAHPREILYPAVVHLALGFILAHNHPSGCSEPSAEDLEFTRAVRRAGEIMGIELYDHLIVSRGGYTSLRERGLL